MPLIFVTAVAAQPGGPEDVAFGRYIHTSGLAIPLVLLLFGSIWLFPLITALVAGDIVASEDHNGTLKTILTRSLGPRPDLRRQDARRRHLRDRRHRAQRRSSRSSRAALVSGFNPLTSLSGTRIPATHALELVSASLLVYLIPILAVACIGLLLSTVTRNSAAAIVGTLMISLLIQLIGILPGLESLQPYLLSTQFNAWQGLLREPADWAPIIRAAWVCSLYALPSLLGAYLVFLRRDVAGG